jgi:hypothetical protein
LTLFVVGENADADNNADAENNADVEAGVNIITNYQN